ncbi:MAG: CHASE2 domain-containing protein [Saprospiraceae bacterium]
MATKRKGSKIWLLSFGNSMLMLCLAFYWLSLPYTFGDEAFLIKWSSLTKKSLFGFDPKPSPKEVLFVNVSQNKTTIDTKNEFEEISPYHRKVITDRQQLAEFFALLNRYNAQVRFVLCDVLFEDTTPYDTLLAREFAKLDKKLLGVSHLPKDGAYIRPVIPIHYAPATYNATQNIFLKFPLVLRDSLKTVPLVMYEHLNEVKFQKKGALYRFNGHLSLPAPIVDFKVRKSDFHDGTSLNEANFAIYQMGTLLEMRDIWDEQDFQALFAGKIILIGDFKDDVHATPFGKMPGLLLIYNAYLTLVSKQNLISVGWICFMLLAFTFISQRIFSDIKVEKPRWLLGLFRSKLGQLILNSLDELALLMLVTLLSYFLFNIHINILIFLLYLKVIDFLWNKVSLHQPKTAAVEEAATNSI